MWVLYFMNKKELKIDKYLPQIEISGNKLNMFIDWWNTDIRFEKSIPHAFEKGYIVVDDIGIKVGKDDKNFIQLVKSIAKTLKQTYRSVENILFNFFQKANSITIYFIFKDEYTLYCEIYDYDNLLSTSIEINTTEINSIDQIDLSKFQPSDINDVDTSLNKMGIAIVATCLWYLATTKNLTKYEYKKETPIITSRHKNIINVSTQKVITTPIYDLNKIKVIKVESLSRQKSGWTYSHAFQVHGHYRHYKNGKTIFIQPFIKGKNNSDFVAQKIKINPKKLK